jgi:hypothetical protein
MTASPMNNIYETKNKKAWGKNPRKNDAKQPCEIYIEI